MTRPIRILHIDDSQHDRELVRDALEKGDGGFELVAAASQSEFVAALAEGGFDLVLRDFNILGFDGLQVIDVVHAQDADLPVVIVTGTGSEEIAVEAMKRGAADYVIKTPTQIRRLPQIVEAVLERKRLEEKRVQMEKTLHLQSAALNAAASAIVITDRDGTIEWVNPAYSALTGYTAEESIGKIPQELVKSDKHHQLFYEQLWAQLLRGEVWDGELINRRKDGSLYTEAQTITPVWNPDGEITHYIAIRQDITARKQAEETLRESERSLKEAQTIAGLGSYVLDVPAGLWKSSDVLDALFGIDETYERSTAGWAALIHPADRQRMVDYLTNEVIGARLNFDEEYRIIRHTDKAERWVHGLGQLEIDAQNRVLIMHGTIQDITERKRAEETLRESEAELRALFAAMQDTVLVIDRAGIYCKIAPTNPAFWYILPQDLIGKRLQDVFSAQQSEILHKVIQQVLETQQTTKVEYELIVGSQSVWYAASISPMDADTTLWVAHDITEEKRVQEALRQRLTELETIHTTSKALRTAQTLDEALPLLLDETLAALNTDTGAILLYDPQADELRSVADRGWFGELRMNVFKPGQGITGSVFSTGETYLSHDLSHDPQAQPFRSGQVLSGWGGACVPIRTSALIVGVMFVAVPPLRQITPEQVKLLESLAEMAGIILYRLRLLHGAQEQARRIQGIMDATPTGILLLDADGQILLANQVAEQDLAVLAPETQASDRLTRLGNHPLAKLLVPPPAQGVWHTVQAGTHTFEIIARPMTDAPAPSPWVLAINDVTQAREQQRYQQAQERLATVGQLAAGIAHDFNNIMGAIALYAGMLRNSPDLSQRQRGQLDTIYDQAQHAANLIRQILDFSRRSVMEKSALDILPLAKEMVKLLERTLPESIRLELVYDRSKYIISGDPTRLQQVLMNLALNARDAMPGGGQLTFTFSTLSLASDQAPPLPDMAAGDWLCLSVTDTGTGIAPENMTHLFEPFFTTKEPGKGTGLGLPQVHGIIKQHGGSLDVTSQVGEGSTFTLYLPMQSLAAPVQIRAATAGPLSGGNEGILVVEDNPAIRLSMVDTLGDLGYGMHAIVNGEEALAVLAAGEPGAIALLITDLVMPGMGGIELAQNVRRLYPAIKILPISGYPLEGDEEILRQMGIHTWLCKPFDISELTAKVRALLDQ